MIKCSRHENQRRFNRRSTADYIKFTWVESKRRAATQFQAVVGHYLAQDQISAMHARVDEMGAKNQSTNLFERANGDTEIRSN